MADYRDLGIIGSGEKRLVSVDTSKYSQVWLATHDGRDRRLSPRYRSFISFSFGDKYIEDFDMIACCEGDSLSRNGYADFEDLVTSYDIMDGQYYHGTHYKPNTLSLRLVTDGIDEKKLNEFLHWFAGGKVRELVLMEHPNRAIMARVARPPELDLSPFEKKITIQIGSNSYDTSTTVYRGFISLELTADFPFWYAKQNILVYNAKNKGIFSEEVLVDDNGASEQAIKRRQQFKEALKVVYEDTVPISNMVQVTMHFGEDSYARSDDDCPYALTVEQISQSEYKDGQTGYWTEIVNGTTQYWKGARIDGTSNGIVYVGQTAGAVMVEEGTELSGPITENSEYYLFYGGTAPSPTTISFSINLAPIGDTGYIDCIANEYVKKSGKDYSSIILTSEHKKQFDFTTPNIITSFNKAKKIFSSVEAKTTNWNDLAETLRDQVRHPAVRAWAIGIVNFLSNNTVYVYTEAVPNEAAAGAVKAEFSDYAKSQMDCFFKSKEGNGVWQDASFEFNAELGTAKGKFYYWKDTSSNRNIYKDWANNDTTHAKFQVHEEDVGDMLRSNWLFIEDHNELSADNTVIAWDKNHPNTAHMVTHNALAPLIDLVIKYKNMYL